MKHLVHIIHVSYLHKSCFFLYKVLHRCDSMLPLCNFRHQIFPSVEGIPSIEEWHGSFLRREKCAKLHVSFDGSVLVWFVKFCQNWYFGIWCLNFSFTAKKRKEKKDEIKSVGCFKCFLFFHSMSVASRIFGNSNNQGTQGERGDLGSDLVHASKPTFGTSSWLFVTANIHSLLWHRKRSRKRNTLSWKGLGREGREGAGCTVCDVCPSLAKTTVPSGQGACLGTLCVGWLGMTCRSSEKRARLGGAVVWHCIRWKIFICLISFMFK